MIPTDNNLDAIIIQDEDKTLVEKCPRKLGESPLEIALVDDVPLQDNNTKDMPGNYTRSSGYMNSEEREIH